MLPAMKLHGTLTSPFVRKLRALAIEKGLSLPFAPVQSALDPNSPAHALNPLAKVPVLETEDAGVLFDSPVIAEYLDALAEPRLIPHAAGPDRWHVLRLCALADGMADAVVARLLETRRPPAQQLPATLAREENRIARALAYLERDVAKAAASPSSLPRPLVGETLTLADLAVAVAIDYVDYRHPHDWRSAAPTLATWLEGIGERPSLRDTAPPQA